MLEMGTKRSAKVMKLGKDEEHNKAVFLWFKQKCEGETNGDEADQLMTSLVPHSVAVRMFDECLKWNKKKSVLTTLLYFVNSED